MPFTQTLTLIGKLLSNHFTQHWNLATFSAQMNSTATVNNSTALLLAAAQTQDVVGRLPRPVQSFDHYLLLFLHVGTNARNNLDNTKSVYRALGVTVRYMGPRWCFAQSCWWGERVIKKAALLPRQQLVEELVSATGLVSMTVDHYLSINICLGDMGSISLSGAKVSLPAG